MIHIVNRGLDGRFIYPSGRDLAGCSEGFMLVLAPYPDYSAETADTRISRAQCLDMNAYAAELSTNVALTHGVLIEKWREEIRCIACGKISTVERAYLEMRW